LDAAESVSIRIETWMPVRIEGCAQLRTDQDLDEAVRGLLRIRIRIEDHTPVRLRAACRLGFACLMRLHERSW
jgi:hypothetical protein